MSFGGTSPEHLRWLNKHCNIYCIPFVRFTSIYSSSPVPARRGRRGIHDQGLRRASEERCMPRPLQRGLQKCGEEGPPGSGRLKMVEKDPNGWERWVLCIRPCCGDLNKGWMCCCFLTCAYSGRRLTSQGQRDLDRIAGQVGCWTLNSCSLYSTYAWANV